MNQTDELMEELNLDLVDQLRSMRRDGRPVPDLLREVLLQTHPQPPVGVLLMRYIRKAFHLNLGQASPVFGWSADGTGELDDSRIDDLIGRAIETTRQQWSAELD